MNYSFKITDISWLKVITKMAQKSEVSAVKILEERIFALTFSHLNHDMQTFLSVTQVFNTPIGHPTL